MSRLLNCNKHSIGLVGEEGPGESTTGRVKTSHFKFLLVEQAF